MSRDQSQDEARIDGIEQLVEYFRGGSKSPSNRRVGTEHEKFVFRGPQLSLTPFDGEGGIEEILCTVAREYDWEPAPDRGRTVALVRNDEAITLEPAGQLELSGGLMKTIFDTQTEFDRHLAELAAVCGPDYQSVSFGLNPWDDLYTVPLMPKARYGVMDRYLHTRGDLARWMMQGTCTIQANLDYTSEEDAVSLVRASVFASPFANALFANSPLRLGKPTGMQSYRAHIWTRTDPDRCGVPLFLYRDDWSFTDWVEWVLDVPMFFIRREHGYVDMAGHSFRAFMADGYQGHQATMGDFELHVSTVFPEVRLKRFVETRSADGGTREHVFALPAFWKGLSYDAAARSEVLDLFSNIAPEDHLALINHAAQEGIHGMFEGRPIIDWCAQLLDIATRGLASIAEADGHADESVFLDPLREIVETGQSLADRLLADFDAAQGDRARVIEPRDLFRAARERSGLVDSVEIA